VTFDRRAVQLRFSQYVIRKVFILEVKSRGSGVIYAGGPELRAFRELA
jgi:hypothetical protein